METRHCVLKAPGRPTLYADGSTQQIRLLQAWLNSGLKVYRYIVYLCDPPKDGEYRHTLDMGSPTPDALDTVSEASETPVWEVYHRGSYEYHIRCSEAQVKGLVQQGNRDCPVKFWTYKAGGPTSNPIYDINPEYIYL